jgi:hypothetical protein
MELISATSATWPVPISTIWPGRKAAAAVSVAVLTPARVAPFSVGRSPRL